MKISELLAEDIHDPKIDWNKFKLALAAHAVEHDPDGYGKFDAIMFLGLAGDPDSQSVLDVKLKGPARIGVADPDSSRELDFTNTDNGGTVAGEYYGVAYHGKGGQGYDIRKEYEYGIIINHGWFNQATGEVDSKVLAHEAQHRGFDILRSIPAIRNAINPRTQKYLDYLMTAGEKVPGLGLEDTGERNFLEHLLIYSFEASEQIGDGSENTHQFRSKEEVKMFRTMYRDIEQAANAYVRRYPVPKGGFELLRKEVDRLTPGNVKIKVSKDAAGKPVVTGVLDQIKNTVKNIFNKGSSTKPPVTNKTGTTPAKPPSEKKLDPVQTSQQDPADELDLIKKNAGLAAQPTNTYTVKPNDTLSKIAQANNISLPDLITANPQIKNPDLIYAGDAITIPK